MTRSRRPTAFRLRAEHIAKAVWQRGREIELLHRAMAFAALCFVTLVPLLIVIAAASPTRGIGISDWIIDGLGLSGRSAQAVDELFAARREVLTTTTALGLAALSFFGISLMTAIQNAYERIWRVESAAWHAVWRQVVALAGLIGYILVAAWSGVPWHDTAAQPALRATATLAGGVLFFWWLQRLLLGSRIRWRTLLPGAVATVAALVGLRVFSRLVFAPLIASNAITYGVIGTVFVVQSWLIGVGYCVYAGAIAGEAFHRAHPLQHRHGPH
ncbi:MULTISPECIES: YhjD/YihY/BrkB family envelope integrity protein [unclassified Kitasatospora]|uniref:YhjD/YihY/BrkB family envelope integrity protein n=1 Tax=unclassified Kitasatospora TaxID=2633591 RepID=UPI001F1A3253|nr:MULTISPECIES: YhjD/YihY/BrkB family envelope integrity protein [unclassified Kitasatospora]